MQADHNSESSQDDGEDNKMEEESFERQDIYVVFTHERELRNVDQVKIKISQFTGVVMRCKNITPQSMENLLLAIEADAINFQYKQANLIQQTTKPFKAQSSDLKGLQEDSTSLNQMPSSGVINLRFEECIIQSKAVQMLKAFLQSKQLLETFFIHKVTFQDPVQDFRTLMEGLYKSERMRKVGVMSMSFDEDAYGKILCHLLNDCMQLKEFDLSQCEFQHPKCFFDMCQALIGEKCRVEILKLKGVHISNIEGKVLQFVLTKNRSLHTLDISQARVDSGECLEFFLQKLDNNSNIRYLVIDGIQPDLSNSIEVLGDALSENNKMEVLIMRENRIKWIPYCNFWENMKSNVSLQKINVSKTELTDRVLEKLCVLLMNSSSKLIDLDLSRNQISDLGLANLSDALQQSNTIQYLNLSQNQIKDQGLKPLVNYLSTSTCSLIELSLMGNKINNDGILYLAEFIKPNTSLKMLDISKNSFGDQAFSSFAAEMGAHATLTFLDISKSKELNDEGSLIILAQQLRYNTYLQTLDLTSVRVRKPFLKMYLEPSLIKNITLKYVLGKITPDIIDEHLSMNIQIQNDVEPNFYQVAPVLKNQFNVHLVDPECNSLLCMKDQSSKLFEAAFKFMQQRDVRQVDFTNMNLQDGLLFQLAAYLQMVPNLCSLNLNGNQQITDDGITRIATSIAQNNKLAHISIMNCKHLGNESLNQLLKVITEHNMMLCSIEFDDEQFSDQQLCKTVRREAALNRIIQEHLRPKYLSQQKVNKRSISANSKEGGRQTVSSSNNLHSSDEVVFMDGAQVHKYLPSAIKCWSITKPVIIQIENQNFTDAHVIQLCEFLKGRDMIQHLNLRRNHITNVGAVALIDWILFYDNSLTHLDISRNRITRAGANAFLAALKKITRIVDFQIAYGNPIPLDVSLAIGYEIIANNQIKANQSENRIVNNAKMTLTSCKYELTDRGPIYMRCAIKSVELLKIIHLSLPDNMLGLEEAKMIAAMIKLNPPLRTLNLDHNNLDAQCGKLLANVLSQNTNLQVLNIQKNKLSDLGINYLLQALIKSRLETIKLNALAAAEEVVTIEEPVEKEQPSLSQQNSVQHQLPAKAPQIQFAPKIERQATMITKNSIQVTKQGVDQSIQQSPDNQKKDKMLNSANTSMQASSSALITEEIEKCETGQLRVLNITENLTTIESYKSIWTLLKINPKVVIYFDSPSQMQQQAKQQTIFHQQQLRHHKLIAQRAISLEETNNQLISQLPSKIDAENPYLSDEDLDAEEEIQPDDSQNCNSNCIQSHNHNMKKITRCCQVLCCFKKGALQIVNGERESCNLVVFWRLYLWKQSLTKFQPNVETFTAYDKDSMQNTITIFFLLNRLCLYIFTILPFFLNEGISATVLAIYLGYLLIFEIIALLIVQSQIKIPFCNPYLWLQIFGGLLKKAGILSVGLVGGQSAQRESFGGAILGALMLGAIALDQYKIYSTMKQAQQIDENSVLPYIERTQRITELFDYQGLHTAIKKITLLPTKNSELLSQSIAQDLNPDLIKLPATGFFQKLFESMINAYHNNKILRHLVLIDLILLFGLVISLACNWCLLQIPVIVVIILLILDSVCCLFQVSEDDSIVSIDATAVYNKAKLVIQDLGERYSNVLMRQQEVSKINESSEESLFETEQSRQIDIVPDEMDKTELLPKQLQESIKQEKSRQKMKQQTLTPMDEVEIVDFS